MRLNRLAMAFTALLLTYLARGEPPRPVMGQVCDEKGPCAGVRVRIKGTGHFTETDAEGRFRLAGDGRRVTAWKEGYFIAGAAIGDGPVMLKLRKLPEEDNPDYEWVDPHPAKDRAMNCGNCHGEIFREWAGSAHGRSAENKRFLNLYDGTDWHGKPSGSWNLLKEYANGASVCAACHAPTLPAEHAGFEDFRKVDGIHRRGVHCDYCHKIADAPLDRLGLEHGRFAYRLLRPREGQLFFGPLDDVDRDEDAYSPLYSKSQYCASCHEGTIFGVKVYSTYSEWLESPAKKQGKQCQTCHMKPTGKMDNIAPGRGGIARDPMTLASHSMPGGAPEMLKSCLRLQVTLENDRGLLTVHVETVAADVGHRVPTGFIDRHLLLLVEGLGPKNERVALRQGPKLGSEAGKGDADADAWAGLPGRFFGRLLEGDDGKSPIPFWRPVARESDTRLAPEEPVRDMWQFPADAAAAVRVRLVYRRFFKEVADAKSWPDNQIVVFDQRIAAPAAGKRAEWKSPTK